MYILAAVVLVFLLLALAFAHAPEGWEDESGFHYGVQSK